MARSLALLLFAPPTLHLAHVPRHRLLVTLPGASNGQRGTPRGKSASPSPTPSAYSGAGLQGQHSASALVPPVRGLYSSQDGTYTSKSSGGGAGGLLLPGGVGVGVSLSAGHLPMLSGGRHTPSMSSPSPSPSGGTQVPSPSPSLSGGMPSPSPSPRLGDGGHEGADSPEGGAWAWERLEPQGNGGPPEGAWGSPGFQQQRERMSVGLAPSSGIAGGLISPAPMLVHQSLNGPLMGLHKGSMAGRPASAMPSRRLMPSSLS